MISLHVLKLALNESTCVSDNEQAINKLRSYFLGELHGTKS